MFDSKPLVYLRIFFEVGDISDIYIYVIYEYMKCLSVDDLWIWDLGRGMEASM